MSLRSLFLISGLVLAAAPRGADAAIAADPVARSLREKRWFFWGHGALSAGILGLGVFELANGEHKIGVANTYIGGSMFALDLTLLMHSRGPAGVDPGALSV